MNNNNKNLLTSQEGLCSMQLWSGISATVHNRHPDFYHLDSSRCNTVTMCPATKQHCTYITYAV